MVQRYAILFWRSYRTGTPRQRHGDARRPICNTAIKKASIAALSEHVGGAVDVETGGYLDVLLHASIPFLRMPMTSVEE